jgi:hypothetical protein
MEHYRLVDGNMRLSQGYFCAVCGKPTSMVPTNHGTGFCDPNPELVQELIKLNRSGGGRSNE